MSVGARLKVPKDICTSEGIAANGQRPLPALEGNPDTISLKSAPSSRKIDAAVADAIIQELADGVGLAERHVSRPLRLAYLAPQVPKSLIFGWEASAISKYDLCFLASEYWTDEEALVLGRTSGVIKPCQG